MGASGGKRSTLGWLSVSACPSTPWISPPSLLTQPSPEMLASQVWSYLRAFASALPSLWDALPQVSTWLSLWLPSPLSLFQYPFVRHLSDHAMQLFTHISLLYPHPRSYYHVFHSLDHHQTSYMYLFIVCPQIDSSGRMETILFTPLPKHIELQMAHGSDPINIYCCCH